MSTLKRLRGSIPAWDMPSDPVKAIWWFLHWLLKVVVNFFWLPVLVMVVYEVRNNMLVNGIGSGIVSGIVTLIVGLVAWAILYGLLWFVNIARGVSRVVSDVKNMQKQQNEFLRQSYGSPFSGFDAESGQSGQHRERERVVEGTITELDEERRKRRS